MFNYDQSNFTLFTCPEYIKIDDLIFEKHPDHWIVDAANDLFFPSVMVDKIKVIVPFITDQIFNAGLNILTDNDGKLLAISNIKQQKYCITIRTIGKNHLEIIGNLTNWMQGHNVYGTNDLRTLIYDAVWLLSIEYDCIQPKSVLRRIANGNYPIYNIDINGMYDLGSYGQVKLFIKHLQHASRTKTSWPYVESNTVYYHFTSRLFRVAIYSKYREIMRKRIILPDQVRDYAKDKLRIEIRMLSNGLRNLKIKTVADLLDYNIYELFRFHLAKIRTTKTDIQFPELDQLQRKAKRILNEWKAESDPFAKYSKSDSTRQRNIKYMKPFGFDLSIPYQPTDNSELISNRDQGSSLATILPDPDTPPDNPEYLYKPEKEKSIDKLFRMHLIKN